MGAEFLTVVGSSLANSSIKRLLSKSEPDLFEIKQVVINGVSDTILFIAYFIKKSNNRNILKRLFTKENFYKFDKDYKIEITNRVGYDVSREILKYDAASIIIPFEKFFDLPDRNFVITIRGRFRQNYSKIFLLQPYFEPIIVDDHKNVYKTKIVVYNKIYDAEELTFINIPFRQVFPLDFLGPKLLTSLELKSYRHLNKANKSLSLSSRRRTQLKQKWGFDPYLLNNVISAFLRELEILITRKYRDFITATSETHSVQVTKMELEFPRVQEDGLPVMSLRPTICFDYSNRDSTIIDILISINKDEFLKQAIKLWHKFKGPKRTYKKTLK